MDVSDDLYNDSFVISLWVLVILGYFVSWIVAVVPFRQDDDEAVITEADLIEQEEQNDDEYIKGGYSPRLLQPGDLGIDEVIYDEEEDAKKLALARSQVCATGRVRVSTKLKSWLTSCPPVLIAIFTRGPSFGLALLSSGWQDHFERLHFFFILSDKREWTFAILWTVILMFQLDVETEFEKAAREGMNDDEAQFSVEMTIEPQAFIWSDKYRPRKPRFFNRVHTVSLALGSIFIHILMCLVSFNKWKVAELSVIC